MNAILHEMRDVIDSQLIVAEFDIHHTGSARDMIGRDFLESIEPEFRDRLTYMPYQVRGNLRYEGMWEVTDTESVIHSLNEPFMRSRTLLDTEIHENDIIVSIDCDEIPYRDAYTFFNRQLAGKTSVRIPMHQFFYKCNYLWRGLTFNSAVACSGGYFLDMKRSFRFPALRDGMGYDISNSVPRMGAHMSWCMPIENMIRKLHCYGHTNYRCFADEKILRDVVEQKTYPFDPNRKFEIKELPTDDLRIPEYIRQTPEKFTI